MSSFRLLSQQVFLVGFGVFELFFFPPCAEFFGENCVRVTIYEKMKQRRKKEKPVSTIQRSTRSATRIPTRSLTLTSNSMSNSRFQDSLLAYVRGHYGKIRLRVLANHSARYIFTSSSPINNTS